ncbi:hypothetical protein THAOC_34730 [Thalassiosira oceanica]|uniref:MYND-type domain-containing protein n=1 Tax=Thalassiosira oceanica TaxID=159749 RepID=K0RIT8_THAOC|nr:hypothetical protein THAOC_34730 [Thalassiosira oceanica]|eukprot:EJK46597.1 hypothetical protein THAOC_34730 [Thalassiosira oceanica]
MPSGKKARGRKNRAKKTADQREQWEPTIVLRDNGASNSTADSSCKHLLAVLPPIPRAGPVVSLMNHMAGEGYFDRTKSFAGVRPADVLMRSLRYFLKVQEEESERSLAINLLLRFVRNVFVHDSSVEGEKWFHQCPFNEGLVCAMIKMLELLETCSDGTALAFRAHSINMKFAGGNRRDVVKFVAKRLPCTCLKKLRNATRKTLEKVGMCCNCLRYFRRSDLYVCTGCNIAEYCSRECQRADWSKHKRILR